MKIIVRRNFRDNVEDSGYGKDFSHMNEGIREVLTYSLGRYDYSGAYKLLKDTDNVPQNIIYILNGCRYAVNFDFRTAYESVRAIKNDKDLDTPMKKWLDDMESLAKGLPDAIFSELLENTRIQLENERYIDFVSRIYRLKEAILKYVFIRYHMERSKITFSSEVLSKQSILKILRKKYKIFNPNLSYAITAYLQKYHSNDWRCNQLIHIINSDKVNALMDLRNASVAGHGFKGVERKDLTAIYGSIEQIIEDFAQVLSEMNVYIQRKKYDRLNHYILELVAKNK